MSGCTMPGCQTTAGCQCGGFPYYPPQVPTITTGGTGGAFPPLSAFAAGYSAALRDAAGHIRTRAEIARRAGLWGDFDRPLLDAASAIEALPVKEGGGVQAIERLIAETKLWREQHRARGAAGQVEVLACNIRIKALMDALASVRPIC